MKRRRHTPEQVIRKLAEGDKLALRDEAWVVASDSSSWLSIPLHA